MESHEHRPLRLTQPARKSIPAVCKYVNMAESGMDARREARRKRILENSENRLQKIFANQSNISSVPNIGRSSTNAVPAFEDGTKISSLGNVLNGTAPKEGFPTVFIPGEQIKPNGGVNDQDSSSSNQLLTSLQELLQNSTSTCATSHDVVSPEVDSRTVSTNFQYFERLRVFCLAIFVRLALAFNFGSLFGEIPLVPFIVVELSTKLLTEKIPAPSTGSGILQMVLLLSGIIPSRATLIIKIFNETSAFVQNLCIYFFTFVLCHAVLDWPG